jgi:hypothetical protein
MATKTLKIVANDHSIAEVVAVSALDEAMENVTATTNHLSDMVNNNRIDFDNYVSENQILISAMMEGMQHSDEFAMRLRESIARDREWAEEEIGKAREENGMTNHSLWKTKKFIKWFLIGTIAYVIASSTAIICLISQVV